MARKLIKRFIPTATTVKNTPALHFLGDLLHDPNLFHLNRHSVSVAFFVGIFIAFIPAPGQMPLAALGALLIRCNLPISVALVWITNPLTMPAIYFACYQFGRWMLQMEPAAVPFEFTWEWISTEISMIWKPLLLGSLTAGLVLATLGYLIMRMFWRWNVVQNWERRKKRRLAAEKQRAAERELEGELPEGEKTTEGESPAAQEGKPQSHAKKTDEQP